MGKYSHHTFVVSIGIEGVLARIDHERTLDVYRHLERPLVERSLLAHALERDFSTSLEMTGAGVFESRQRNGERWCAMRHHSVPDESKLVVEGNLNRVLAIGAVMLQQIGKRIEKHPVVLR